MSCPVGHTATPELVRAFKLAFLNHLEFGLGKDRHSATRPDLYQALATAVRDVMVERWLATLELQHAARAKRVYYLSMEFMIGRTLGNALLNLGLLEVWRETLAELGLDYAELEAVEWDAGLGNGGLGRLAACFLESLATLAYPAYGYGIRYEYGIFYQKIVDGAQVEMPDNWLRYGNPWEFPRREHLYVVKFGGRLERQPGADGRTRVAWIDTEDVVALPYDTPVPGYHNENVNTMRLWSAKSTREFDLGSFSAGNYIGSVEKKMLSENISKVLYPADHNFEGRNLRLKQEYFLVSATVQDILHRFRRLNEPVTRLADFVAIQLNDTHPALAIPELLRLLMDEEGLEFATAWPICVAVFGYTNHTVLPEALERWSVPLLAATLPRHLELIYQINAQLLAVVATRYPGDLGRLARISLIEEGAEQKVRMAALSVVGSHSVNGVSALHSQIVRDELFRDFAELYPTRFNNKTNGITQRRWLLAANPELASLICSAIGDDWVTNLGELARLRPLAEDSEFVARWLAIKRRNKARLVDYITWSQPLAVDLDALFDCQVKRIHEYKRQLLNLLHVITLYGRLKADPTLAVPARVVLFAGKAAPSYQAAKLIIRLINAVAATINADPAVAGRLQVLFLPNYNVSLAERIFPAADLSEQISTAGTEASGTGNMKFALNGALTIGTLDGANIELRQEVGADNFFAFGLTAPEVTALRARGYNPREMYNANAELRQTLDLIASGAFAPEAPDLFRPLVDSLLTYGDYFLLLADYADYIACQDRVGALYLEPGAWGRLSVLNAAGSGWFSSDRTIREYAAEIWGIAPLPVSKDSHRCDAATVCLLEKQLGNCAVRQPALDGPYFAGLRLSDGAPWR